MLYRIDMEKKKHKEQVRRELSLLKEMEELKQCTFKPKLNKSDSDHGLLQWSTGKIYERNKAWIELKEKKLEVERKKEKKQELKACTFKPNTIESNNTFFKVI